MSNEIEQSFKELQSKNQKIAEGVIKINTQIEAAQTNYKKLQELAMSKFQTSDIEELKITLQKWRDENKQRYELAKEKVNKLENNYNETLRLIKEIQDGQE